MFAGLIGGTFGIDPVLVAEERDEYKRRFRVAAWAAHVLKTTPKKQEG